MPSDGLGYFLRWETAICGLIIVPPFAIAVYVIMTVKAEPLYFKYLWKSQWKELNPLWLLCHRALAFICMTLIFSKIVASAIAHTFYYYTRWTFILVTLYFVLGTLISAYGCFALSNGPLSENHSIKIQQIVGFGADLMQILYQICGDAVILTDIGNWYFLVPFSKNPSTELTNLGIYTNSLNAVFLLLDTALNSMPFPLFWFSYFVLWSCLYIFFRWAVHACCSSCWPYGSGFPVVAIQLPMGIFTVFCIGCRRLSLLRYLCTDC